MVKRLNVGCGYDIRNGWVNLDHCRLPGVDIVHDIEKLPLPFRDEEFDEILCQDVLEHVNYVPLLRDLHRILKKGGCLTIQATHFTSSISFTDPTHKRLFTSRTFEFFTKDSDKAYYIDFHFDMVSDCRITLERGYDFGMPKLFSKLTGLLEKWINATRRRRCFYEDTFLSRLFPGRNIFVKLIK